jgi:hypothetical protein
MDANQAMGTHSSTLKGKVNALDEVVGGLRDELKLCKELLLAL